MSDRPSFDELAGGEDLTREERARLERVHDLLVAAGPPPELPPHLREPEPLAGAGNVSYLPRRRAGLLIALAATIALVSLLGGYVWGQRHAPFGEVRAVPMHATAGSTGSAVLHVGKADSAGNWPLKVDVKNLPALPKGQYYEMFLSTEDDPLAASCGTFRASGESQVRLNAPYSLSNVTGWVVTREKPGSGKHPIVLTT